MSERGYEEQLGRQLYQQGRFEEAEVAFRLAITKRPDLGRLHLALALCIDPEERPDEALSIFRRAAELDGMLADAHNGIGICEPDLQRAERAFRQAIVIEPHTADFHANLAFCLLRQGRPQDAEPCLRQAIGLEPNRLGLMGDWGELLLELGRPRDAEVAMRKKLSALGDRRALLDKRTWVYYEQERYQEAEQRVRSLRAGGSADEAWLYFVLGRALLAQHRADDALDALRIAVAMCPENAEMHELLGRTFEALRRPDAAGAAYRRASQLLG